MEDSRRDDTLDELVVGRPRRVGGVARTGVAGPGPAFGQAGPASTSDVRLMPESASNRWSLDSGRIRLSTSPGLTRCDESTIATTSFSAAVTCRSSSLPRYS